jgi:DNA-binding NarL/FixJ family response regulator
MHGVSQAQPCRILLADDHAILRHGLRKLISEDTGFDIVGEAGDGQELLTLLAQVPCDIVLMDLSMPVMNGFQALEVIKKDYPLVRVLLLTMHNSHEYFKQAVNRGADGYILKEDVYESLLWALNTILAGHKAFSPKLASMLVGELFTPDKIDAELEILSRRELEVLHHLANGGTSRAIAEKLGISARTVESHRAHIMEKLGLKNTASLVRFAIDHKLH